MREAIFAFIRGFVASGVAVAAAFITSNLDAPAEKLITGAAIAFLTGAIAFIGQYLRDANPQPLGKALSTKQKSKLYWLPF